MNKLVVPGVIGAATAAAGTAGVVKYKKKKHMENEMSKAIMSVLPQDLSEEERMILTRSIMKGASESTGLDKLAFVTCVGTLLFRDKFNEIIKEATEEFKNEIKNEVIEVVASMSDEVLKQAGVEYGFTAYKDDDGEIEKLLRETKNLNEGLDKIDRTNPKHREIADKYLELLEKAEERGNMDYKIYDKLKNLSSGEILDDVRTYWAETLNNKHLAQIQGDEITDLNENILAPSEGFKFRLGGVYGSDTKLVSDARGAEAVRQYLANEAFPAYTKGQGENEAVLDSLTEKGKQLSHNLALIKDERKNIKFYQPIKRLRNKGKEVALKAQQDSLETDTLLAMEKIDAYDYSMKNLKKWDETLDDAINTGNNLYQWQWY